MSLEFELPLISFIFVLMLCVVYFSKKKVGLVENRFFGIILSCSLINTVIDTFIHFLCACTDFSDIVVRYYDLFNFLNKIMSTMFVVIFACLFCYILTITYSSVRSNINKLYRILGIFTLVFFGVMLFTNIELIEVGSVTNVKGSTIEFGYIFVALFIALSLFLSLLNIKKKDVRYLSIFLLLFLAGILYFVSLFFAGIIIYDVILAILCYLMYFTIENPDLKMIEELNVARTHAERANLAKSEFLSSMSHEIRTPLNAIVGFSDCILRENDLQVAKEDAKDIVTASKNLLEIVNGILDISKIEANKMEIIETDYNPRETIYNLVKLVVPRIGEKPIEMKVGITQDLPKVLHGDVKKLKQIVTNILTNAVKYTDKGTITVMVTCLNQDGISLLSISVEDTGRGIKPEKIDKLFTKFERLDEDRNTTIEGTGLGLAITKRLVEMMGGKIIVQSKFGEGSKFTVYLKQRISDKKEIIQEKKEVVAKHYPGKKILVVDDNKINLKVATKILKELEISVEEVDNGFSCIEKIQNGESYDMILLDDMMPRMSGSETLVQLKKIPDFSIPVIMLTANAIEGMKEEYLKKGFDDYLAKPISRKELYRVLNQYLGGHQEVENKNKIDFGPLPQEIFEFGTTIEQGKITYDLDYLRSKGIDVDKGLSLLGDEETYREMMTTFLQEIDQKIEKMKNFMSDENTKEYAVLAHGVKSDAKYFGFTELADIAYQHELKGKDNNIDFITTHWDEFEQEINRMKEIIRPYLDK